MVVVAAVQWYVAGAIRGSGNGGFRKGGVAMA